MAHAYSKLFYILLLRKSNMIEKRNAENVFFLAGTFNCKTNVSENLEVSSQLTCLSYFIIMRFRKVVLPLRATVL